MGKPGRPYKLSFNKCKEVLKLYKDGEKLIVIATMFNVSEHLIRRLAKKNGLAQRNVLYLDWNKIRSCKLGEQNV